MRDSGETVMLTCSSCRTANDPGSRFCRNCGKPFQGQPGPVRASPPTPPPQPVVHQEGSGTNWAGLFWALVVVVPTALWGFPRWMGGKTSSYEIRVETTPPGEFSGSYGITESSGTTSQKSVDGFGSATYPAGSGMFSVAVFQKKTEGGLLVVEVLRDGQPYKREFTSAEYGVVSVSAD